MENKLDSLTFKILREALGLTQVDLADRLEVNRRSVRRWEDPDSGYPPPLGISTIIEEKWGNFADRVAETLELAEAMEDRGEPVTLIAYADELQCMTRTGLSLSEHRALLGHISMALTCGDFSYEIVTAPPGE